MNRPELRAKRTPYQPLRYIRSVRVPHAITHVGEARIRAAVPEADSTVHQEPAGLKDERLDTQIAAREG